MNLLAWVVALSILIILMIEAVTFHKATVCRQKAWLKSTELLTRKTLSRPPEKDEAWDLGCKLIVKREKQKISWQRLPNFEAHDFGVELRGGL